MPRVKRGTKRRASRHKTLERASGYFLTKSKLHRAAQEVGGIEQLGTVVGREREALVHGGAGMIDHEHGGGAGVPRRDRALFAGKDEAGRLGRGDQEIRECLRAGDAQVR